MHGKPLGIHAHHPVAARHALVDVAPARFSLRADGMDSRVAKYRLYHFPAALASGCMPIIA
jgi:hypothetical protein